jgi:hypothetical protein
MVPDMESLHKNIYEYREQLKKGAIQKAYRGLMGYLQSLRAYFQKAHPEFSIPGSLYFGYMDMTYFSVVPKSLKQRNLKIAIVFLHEAFRFEVWLAAANKQVQTKYWKLIKESSWDQYHLTPILPGNDAIIDHILVEQPDFSDLDALTRRIDSSVHEFIKNVENFLALYK